MAKKRGSRTNVQVSPAAPTAAEEEIQRHLLAYAWPSHFFYAHDTSGVFIYVSPSVKDVLGFSPAEFCRHFTAYLTDNPINEEVRRRTESSCKGIPQPPYEVETRTKDGGIKRLLIHEFPIRDAEGRVSLVAGMAMDITRQIQMENALRASEEKYRTFVESASEAIFTVDREGRFLFMNAAAARDVGGKPEDYVGKTLWDIFPPPVAERHIAAIRNVIDAGSDLVFAEAPSILQGEERWYHTTIKPIAGPNGKTVAMLIARDITARKRAEDALRQSEERYRHLLENLNDIFFACDDRGIFTYISSHVERYGLKPADMIGKCIFDFMAAEDRDWMREEFTRAMATHDHRQTCFRFRDAHGCIHWFEENSREIHNKSGETIGLMGMIRDVTERVQAEEQLRLSEEKYRSVVDNVDIGIAIISPDMEILALNNRMREWFPDVRPEAKPICYRSFNQPPREQVCSYCPVVLTFADGQVHRSVTETPRGSETHNYRIVASPLRNARGEVISVIELVEDITEERRLAERLVQSERLAAVGTLAAGAAHEFNNLNVGILGFTDLALTNPHLTPDIRMCLERIRNAARRGRNLTANLLGFASAKKAHRVRGNLRPVISETVDLIWRQLEAAGVDIELRLHPLPDTVMDANQIGQIILNLLVNARQAVKNSPEKTIMVETGVRGNRLFARVSDTGCGISPENLDRIFEPFFSTRPTSADGTGGTGLGLYVSRLIAESHGGSLEVESEVGRGTAFTLWLPIEEAPPPSPPQTEEKLEANLAGLCALVIDDDPDTVDLLSILLSREQMTVVAERDAEAGCSRLASENFDIAIVDIMMPGLSGEEFLKRLQSLPPARRPAVIVLTGCAEREVQERCRQLGAAEVLAKPFELDEMLRCIKRTIRKRRNA